MRELPVTCWGARHPFGPFWFAWTTLFLASCSPHRYCSRTLYGFPIPLARNASVPASLRLPLRFEFMEALVRLAFGRYVAPGEVADGSDATRLLLQHLRAVLPQQVGGRGRAAGQGRAARWHARVDDWHAAAFGTIAGLYVALAAQNAFGTPCSLFQPGGLAARQLCPAAPLLHVLCNGCVDVCQCV